LSVSLSASAGGSWAVVRRPDLLSYRTWAVGAFVGGLLLAAVMARQPFLAAGAVGGALVLMMLLVRPVLVLGALLAIGGINLAFLTGGYKELLGGLGGIDMNGIRLIGAVTGLGGLVLIDRGMLRELMSPAARWYLLFLLFATGTLAISPAPIDGLRLLFKLAYPLLIFVAVTALIPGEEGVDRLVAWTLVAAIVLVFMVNPILVIGGGYVIDEYGQIRVQGLGQNQNPFSYYLLALSLLSLARFIFRGDRRWLVLALGLSAWIIVTFSRMTLLAAVGALTAMAVYGAALRRDPKPLVAAILLGLTLAIPLTPVVLERSLGFVPTVGELWSLVTHPAGLVEMMHWGGRDRIWPVLLRAFRESPAIGLGLGTSADLMQTSFADTFLDVPHNEYLRLLVDTGIVGTVLFFVAVMAWLVAAVRAGWTAGGVAREYALAAVGCIVAWSLIALTGNPLDYYNQFTQYAALFVAGAVVSARKVVTDAPDESGVASPAEEAP
jgi:putative inorganic carbon (HCO3(-)) transporter